MTIKSLKNQHPLYLNCHSYYSFRYGTLSLEELLKEAQKAGQTTVALTDINSTSGTLDFIRLAPEYGVRPVAGIDFRNGVDSCFVALALNNEGFYEINRYLSHFIENKEEIPLEAPEFSQVYVIYPFEKAPRRKLADNEFIGLKPSQLTKFRFSDWRSQQSKFVVLQPMTFRNKRDHNAHRLLRSIDLNTLLSKLPDTKQSTLEDSFWHPKKLEAHFDAFPQIVENTKRILADCEIHFNFRDYEHSHNKSTYTGSLEEDRALIRTLCKEGLEYRYGQPSQQIMNRVEHELEILEKKNFYSYFLINWDIVNYARRKDYFYVGRGSGANSMVAYLLRITDVDPVELDLYFERFINPSRKSPPDFDIDFSWRDRQDVTQYIFNRFPTATLLGSHTTFQYRAVVRELGKVLGLPAREIDQLSSPRLDLRQLDDMAQLVIKYSNYIKEFPNFVTIHASGILIPQRSVHHYGATFLPPKGFPTTYFDMYIAEDVGLHKFDILGQRGLAKIKEAMEVIRYNQPETPRIDIHDMSRFKRDEKIRELLKIGKTMACFYIESPAMRSLLKKLQVETYLGLVAASSIIRPGVAQSGMMAEYIKRFRNPEARQYIHPRIGEILKETFGVMVYQEDVLKVAHYFAGLTLEEADILRRGMSWKFRERNEFWRVKERFFENCREYGYKDEVTKEIWRQIESFANYAFAKGHSASYAVESYQSLFLKAYFPLEYMVATINNGGGFYRTEIYVHEARLHGGEIESPCVNHSRMETVIEGKSIYLGFQHMKALETKVAEAIVGERRKHGPFTDLQDFVDRVAISLEQLILLIRINAFRSSGKGKKELLWEAHFLLGASKKSSPTAELFRTRPQKVELPDLEDGKFEDAYDEIEILGFPLCSPFRLVDHLPKDTVMARQLPKLIGKQVQMAGYLVHVKNLTTRSDTPRHMQFGCFLDEEGDFIDTVHFPQTAAKYRFQGNGCYLLRGKVVSEYDAVSLEVHHMEKLPMLKFQEA